MLRHLELKKEIKIIKVINYCTGDGNLLKKYRAIWTKIEDLINIEWKVLLVYDNRYIKSKIKTHGDKVYSNFCGLNMQEHDIESESFKSFLSTLCLYTKTNITDTSMFRQCTYKMQTNKWQIILIKIFLKSRCYKWCITKELI